VLEQDGVAAQLGSKMPMLKTRSMKSSRSVMPRTGVARIWMVAVAYMPQTNSGIWNQPMPGARSLWVVAMKLTPVKMEEKPRTKAARTIIETPPPVVVE